MKPSAIISLSALLIFSSCLPKKAEIPVYEVPAGPLIQAMEQRLGSFNGLMGTADLRIERKGRRRALENAAIILGRNRLRIEAYGPLGQPILAIAWNGQETQVFAPAADLNAVSGPGGLERLLGPGIGVKDLWAALSGNVAEIENSNYARAYCPPGNACMIEIKRGDAVRRIGLTPAAPGQDKGGGAAVAYSESFKGGSLVYRARFEQIETISDYRLPKKIVIEKPDKKFVLTVTYTEAEVNVPVPEDLFRLSPPEETGP